MVHMVDGIYGRWYIAYSMWSMGGCQNLWSPFESPKYFVPYYTKDPKMDHNFDNQPYDSYGIIQI